MKKLIVLTLLMCAFQFTYSQQATVKGTIVDTLNQIQLHNAVIMLLQPKDSTLYKFSRSNETGKFEIPNLKQGKYIMVVSYPTFADYVDTLTLDSGSVRNVNKIVLTQLSKLLKEVVVKQQIAAIRMKGDTTEYNAGSFKTAENANIEDLLKVLPGIEVNSKGEIKAMGESVKKVLVDGEEFFGDDPTLVTKNLRADMVDKVQLYDKKSDQASFTGVDDGERSRTLNIQLKEDKKKGAFGKVAAGGGTESFFDNQIMFNYFKGKKKISAFGILSNTGQIGLNWNDRDKFGAGNGDFSVNEDGDFDFSSRGDDYDSWDGKFGDNGYPLVQTGGIHYNDKWDKDKQRVNANYKIMNLGVEGSSWSKSQVLTKDTTYYDNSSGSFENHIFRNRLDGDYELKFDSTSSIRILVDGALDHKNTVGLGTSTTWINDVMKNSNDRKVSNVSDNKSINANIFWRKKFKKDRRNMSFNLSETYENSSGRGIVDATTTFYRPNEEDSLYLLDQLKIGKNDKLNINANLTYTEPISKYSTITLNYGFNWLNNNSNRYSYNQDPLGKYSALDSIYSNDFSVTSFTNHAGINYGYTKNKVRVSFGSSAGLSNFTQTDRFRDHEYNRQFINFYPKALFRYNFSQYRRFAFTYNGNTSQPSLGDLQPLVVNDNPLYIKIGNADLKPSFQNSFNMNFSDYKVVSQRGIWISMGYNFVLNSFSSKNDISSNGVTTSQTVNLNGNRYGWFNFNYNWMISPWKLRIGPSARVNLSRNVNYTKSELVTTNTINPSMGLFLNKYVDKKYEFGFDGNANYHSSVSSVQRIQPNYWDFEIRPSFGLFLPAKFTVNANMNWNLRQKTSVFTGNNNVAIVNASINKKFGKKDDIILGVSVNDLLNQNIGINRSIYDNTISESHNTTIRRYFMLTFVWNFTKLGGATPAPAPVIK
ncbi:TonB-dependent receptor [Chitinophaga silvatica]|uniref:TonB-dependent receptor n=1 Tax=Chitinophaga silvatica TaxID=2282649 RepID=A0A3E1Y6G8_9BACT|nr:outer membrane beta-barrel protein [Chitinophaga silvatica]RFS20488.1 TonB-dependent receptor [Chitinophaga silvatica]